MPLPLFIDQPFCRSRHHCTDCRSKSDDRYRNAWAGWYTMPAEWPECPFGVPWGVETNKGIKPVDPNLLAVLVDTPDSSEAEGILAAVNHRADNVRPICLACPNFVEISDNGLIVTCKIGHQPCCGGGPEEGAVHLAVHHCPKGDW